MKDGIIHLSQDPQTCPVVDRKIGKIHKKMDIRTRILNFARLTARLSFRRKFKPVENCFSKWLTVVKIFRRLSSTKIRYLAG